MMKAILSCTADDLYSFNLPFAVYSWHKLGIDCIILCPVPPFEKTDGEILRFGFARGWSQRVAPNTKEWTFSAPPAKHATYTQCARLYAAATDHVDPADILITADADMCVFNEDFWDQFDNNGWVNVIGADLVPEGQVPMCYISAPAVGWENFMKIRGRTLQECLDDLLSHLEAEHFRGNYWAKDQETAYQHLSAMTDLIIEYNRAKPGTQFAKRRADRDGWVVTPDIIDAHLPRPGYTEENFNRIFSLFETMYPHDDHAWMRRYRDEYVELMK